MAETVTPRDWRRRKASHTTTTDLHLPPELAEWVGKMTETIRNLQGKVHDLETAELRRRERYGEMVQGFEDILLNKRGAA